jgi:AraC family transcriptional regulator
MDTYKSGQFSGHNNNNIGAFTDVTVTASEFEYKFIDWHSHENPYFSLTLAGHCLESDRRKTYSCSADSLLFHNAGESHYNVKSGDISFGFQVEISPRWYQTFEVGLNDLPATAQVDHPGIKLLIHNIYKEAHLSETSANLTVDALLIEAFETLRSVERTGVSGRPRWVGKIDEMLHENFGQPISLLEISAELNVHWAHLSRDFPKYFHCNFSQYIRKIKVEKSLGLLRKRSIPMADIACICGFADQSHFIRCFKQYTGLTPKNFRKIIK